jgi:hypothetical protein
LFNPARVGPGFVDWDLVTCINEIRNYMYGGLHEGQISAFLANTARLPHVRGLMASLPLVQSSAQLRQLDGWLLNVLKRAQRERARVVTSFGSTLAHISESQLIDGSWYDFLPVPQDMTLPSFVRCWRASKKFYRRYGLSRIKPPPYYSLLSY